MLKSKFQISEPISNPHWNQFQTRIGIGGLVICNLLLGIFNIAYALDLGKVKFNFISGDYKQVISECEKILAGAGHSKEIDELYYLLGLGYLKEGNFPRAADIFNIILKDFPKSAFKDEAMLGLGDTYLLREQYAQAQKYYHELINNNPRSKLLALVYFRLSLCAGKSSDTQLAKEYLDKLKRDFPLSPEARLDRDLYSFPDFYYTVQVGSFLSAVNAKNLAGELNRKGYAAYIEEMNSQDKIAYRVRAGKLRLRKEAEELADKLTQEGYPVRVFP